MIVGWDHLGVERHQLLFANLPDMHVMDVTHFRNIQAQILLQFIDIYLLRCSLQQFMETLLQQAPGAAQYQAGNQDREYRIDGGPAGSENDDGCCDRPDRAEQVTKNM